MDIYGTKKMISVDLLPDDEGVFRLEIRATESPG